MASEPETTPQPRLSIRAYLTSVLGTFTFPRLHRAPATPEERVQRRVTLRLLLQVCGIWLVTRLIYAVITRVVLARDASGVSSPAHIGPRDMVHAWVQFDAIFYLRIAAEGYTRANKVDDAFLPLYPVLIKGGTLLLGQQHAALVALIIANAALLMGFIGVAFLARHDTHGATQSVPYVLLAVTAYPLAFFLSAPWTDGLFLCFAAWTLYGVRSQRWNLAATCTFLALLTRISGLVLVLPLVVGYVLAQWPRLEVSRTVLRLQAFLGNSFGAWRYRLTSLWVLASPVLAIGLLALIYWRATGDALTYLHREHGEFGHATMPPWVTVTILWRQITATTPLSYRVLRVLVDAIPLALVALFLVCFALPWRVPLRSRWRERLMHVRWLSWLTHIGAVRPMPLVYSLYLAGLVAMCVAQPVVHVNFPNAILSSGRYLTAAVPLWLALGRWMERRPWLQTLLMSGGWALQAVLLGYYLQGGWLV